MGGIGRFATAILALLFLPALFAVGASPVAAQDNWDENRISNIENQLRMLENLPGDINSISSNINSILDRLSDIENLSSRISALENLFGQPGYGREMVLFAVSPEDGGLKPLSFSLQVIQSGEWELLTVSPGSSTLVWILDSETSELVQGATLELRSPMTSQSGGDTEMIWWWMMMGQGGLGGYSFSLPIQNGVGVLPAPEGMGGLWSGIVSADGYASQSFFYRVGEVPPTTGEVASVHTTPATLVRTQAATVSAWDEEGNLVEDAKIYIDGVPHTNPASIVCPDVASIQLLVKVGGETVYGPTSLYTVEPTTSGTGEGAPWGTILTVVIALGVLFLTIRYRGKIAERLSKLKGMKRYPT